MKNKSKLFLIIPIFSLLMSCSDNKGEVGDKFYATGDYEKAVQSYSKHLETNPSHIKSLYNRGRSYEELGQR